MTAAEIESGIPINDIRVCLIGHSGFMYDIAVALKESGLRTSCIATHVEDSGKHDEISLSLAQRGLHYSMAQVAAVAEAPLLYFSDLNSEAAIAGIRETNANIVISCSAPILKSGFIEYFEGMTFNFHTSNIYRGRGGASWAILNGHRRDAVVLHWLDVGIDTGGKIVEESFEWNEDAYPIDLMDEQRHCFRNLIGKFSKILRIGSIPCLPQDSSRPYLPTLYTHIDGEVDWNESPEVIEKVVRAFGWPYQGAGATIEQANRKDRTNVRLGRVRVTAGAGTTGLHPKTNGCIIARTRGGNVSVVCGGGILDVETLRQGTSEVLAADTIRIGMRFVETAGE